ncbi:MAG TPA: hypothetical protein VFG83_10625, partial [Kofleriaceae bacterium]|nr:hypothetical protein [Kofleriaceae bacterium]
MASGIRFSPGGNLVAFREGDAISVVSVPGLRARGRIEARNLADFALFDDQVWVVCADPAEIRTFAVTGEAIAGPVAVPGGPATLRPSPFGPPSALLLAKTLTRITTDHDQLALLPIEGAFDFALPLDGTTIAAVVKDALWIGRGEVPAWKTFPVRLPAAASDGSALFEARTVALVTGEHLLVYAVDGGALLHKLRLRAINAARFSAQRGYAVLRGGDSKLVAIDLRIGRVIKTFDEERRIVDFAIDAGGQHLVLLLGNDNGRPEPVYTTFKALLAAEPAAPADASPSEPGEAAPAAEEEPDADRDRRSRQSARAATRRAADSEARNPAHDDGEESAGPIAVPELCALSPRIDVPLADETLNTRWLGAQLKFIGALCHRAIASAWNSGRLAFEDRGPLPFHSEVPAILGRGGELAKDELARANNHLAKAAAAARAIDQELAATGRVPGITALRKELGLSEIAVRILLTIAAPSLWGELSRLYGILANDVSRPLCDELLVCQISGASESTRAAIARELDPDQPLSRYGIIRFDHSRARPFQGMSLAPSVIRRIQGQLTAPGPG